MHSRRTALVDCHRKWQGFQSLVTVLREKALFKVALCSPPLCNEILLSKSIWGENSDCRTCQPVPCWSGQQGHNDPLTDVDPPSTYALFSQKNVANHGERLDVSLNAYIAGVGGREMKCGRKARSTVSVITFVLCVIAEKVTGTSLLCHVLLCNWAS